MTMQPQHKQGGYLRESFEALKAQAEAQNVKPAQPPNPAPFKPAATETYHAAIAAWVHALSPIQRQRRYTITEIAALVGLKGEKGKRASVQAMGTALHACGFKPKRDWTKAGRNRRWWQII